MDECLIAPLTGREAIRSFANTWPRVVNREERRAIDGECSAIGWNERHYDAPEDAIYRGISTYVINAAGEIFDYEGIFDPGKIAAAYAKAQ